MCERCRLLFDVCKVQTPNSCVEGIGSYLMCRCKLLFDVWNM